MSELINIINVRVVERASVEVLVGVSLMLFSTTSCLVPGCIVLAIDIVNNHSQ